MGWGDTLLRKEIHQASHWKGCQQEEGRVKYNVERKKKVNPEFCIQGNYSSKVKEK